MRPSTLTIEVNGVEMLVEYHPGWAGTRHEPPEPAEVCVVSDLSWGAFLAVMDWEEADDRDQMRWEGMQLRGESPPLEEIGESIAWDRIERATAEAMEEATTDAAIAAWEDRYER